MKTCTKCNLSLPESFFNKHSRTKSGLRSVCRACQHLDYKRYIDTPSGKAKKISWSQSLKGKIISKLSDLKRNKTEHRKAYKSKSNPTYWEQKKAHDAVYRAIKNGSLVRKDCEYAFLGGCNGVPQAHHEDYNKPLDVRWLCVVHHKQVHLSLLK